MADTLYRKYRPQRFADLVNQQHIRLTLQNAIEHDRVAHAYLFAGPRGVGKTTVARLLARSLNCQNRQPDAEPCNECPTCLAMLKNSALDIIEVDAASQTGVDNVRDNIIQSARSTPSMGKYKVFIIDEVHMLSLAAFNALLKLMEEPPAHAIFILATTEVHRVPETIISRTQRFDFKKIGVAEIVNRLQALARDEKRTLDKTVPERIARAAGGSLRDAESMLGQLFSFEQKNITAEVADLVLPRSDQATILGIIEAVSRSQAKQALDHFHRFCNDGGDIPNLAHDLVVYSRIMMMLSLDAQLLTDAMDDVDQSTAQVLLELGRATGLARATTIVEAWLEAERQVQRSNFEELPIELAIMKLCLNSVGPTAPSPSIQHSAAPKVEKSAPTPKPESQKTAPKKKASVQGGLDLSVVQAIWKKIQQTIGQTHPSLGLSIQHAEVSNAGENTVTLQVPFQLHVDRLSDPKHHQILQNAVREALGQDVVLEVVRGDRIPEAPPMSDATTRSTPMTQLPKNQTTEAKNELWDQVVGSFS